MANIFATKTGNWSDVTVWNTGALPTSSDDVYANNFTVTINQNITVLSIRNTSTTGVVVGGSFLMNSAFNVSADVYASSSGTACLRSTGFTGGTVTLTGNWYGGTTYGSYAVQFNLMNNATFIFYGNSYGGINQQTEAILLNGNNCSLAYTGAMTAGVGVQSPAIWLMGLNWTGTITGNPNGGAGNTSGNTYGAFYLLATSSNITVYGNCTGGPSGNWGAYVNGVSSTLTIVGIATGGGASGVFGAYNGNTGSILRVYSAVGSTLAEGVGGVSGAVTTVECITNCLNGSYGVGANVRMKRTANNQITVLDESGNAFTLSDPTNVAGQVPSIQNVRTGISYLGGSVVGTLVVPSPANVRTGVPTDNTTGTAAMTPADIVAAVQTAFPRLGNVATVQSTGDQLAALNP